MKKTLSRSLVCCIAISLMTAAGAIAQGSTLICKPICDYIPWQCDVTTAQVTCASATCNFQVEYCSRHNTCANLHEVQITRLVPLSGTCDLVCGFYNIFGQAIGQLLLDNPMRFPLPSAGACRQDWRVVIPACWQEGGLPQIRSYIPCTGACCTAIYKVCLSSNATRSIEQLSVSGASLQCSSSAGCQAMCGALPSQYSKRGSALDEFGAAAEDNALLIVPNPARDHIRLRVPGAGAAAMTFSIYDAFGKTVLRAGTLRSVAGALEAQVDVADLVDGIYFVKVRSGGAMLSAAFVLRR